MINQTGWAGLSACVGAVVIAAGMSFVTAPAQAAYELPGGERITHLPVVARAIPNKEEYELYDPKIGKNFDITKFWLRADLRVRPEMRNGTCFGSAMNSNTGNCNTFTGQTSANGAHGKANESFVLQKTRLGIGYDLSPDLNFYMELIYSAVWGGNGARVPAFSIIRGLIMVRRRMASGTAASWASERPTCWSGISQGSKTSV